MNVTVIFQHAASHRSQRLVYIPPTDASSVGEQDMFGWDASGHCTLLDVSGLHHPPRLLSLVHTGHLRTLVHSHPVAKVVDRSRIASMSIISFLCDAVRGTHS